MTRKRRKRKHLGREPADVIAEFEEKIRTHLRAHPDPELKRLAGKVIEMATRASRPHPGRPPNPEEPTQAEIRHRNAGFVGREIKRRLLEKDEARRERLREILQRLTSRDLDAVEASKLIEQRKARLVLGQRMKDWIARDPISPDDAHDKAAKIVARLLRYIMRSTPFQRKPSPMRWIAPAR
jgi:hypothetical protein